MARAYKADCAAGSRRCVRIRIFVSARVGGMLRGWWNRVK
jgi:hypothetical protein